MKHETSQISNPGWRLLAVLACVVVSVWAVVLAVSDSRNPHGHLTGQKTCAECHAGDLPRVHTAEFVEKEHMNQAYLNWQTCMSCHWQKSCNDCHEMKKSMPEYHSPEFLDTAGKGRMQHVLYARMRPESCMACHTHRYASTCGKCHQPHQEKRR